MENLEKILIAIIAFVVTSVIAYLFRMRQLYAATPRFYRNSSISKDGSLCEITIYNRGNQSEEDITVGIDPDLKVELIASDSPELVADGPKLSLPRLHKLKTVSAIILVEGGIFDHTKILEISSKSTQGRVLKTTEGVPPNWALLLLFIAVTLSFFPAIIYGNKLYRSYSDHQTQQELQPLLSRGWSNLSQYGSSTLRSNYSKNEFPAKIIGRKLSKDGRVILKIEFYNKTALTMKTFIDATGGKNTPDSFRYYKGFEIEPLTMRTVEMYIPDKAPEGNILDLDFSFQSDDYFVYGVVGKVDYSSALIP